MLCFFVLWTLCCQCLDFPFLIAPSVFSNVYWLKGNKMSTCWNQTFQNENHTNVVPNMIYNVLIYRSNNSKRHTWHDGNFDPGLFWHANLHVVIIKYALAGKWPDFKFRKSKNCNVSYLSLTNDQTVHVVSNRGWRKHTTTKDVAIPMCRACCAGNTKIKLV